MGYKLYENMYIIGCSKGPTRHIACLSALNVAMGEVFLFHPLRHPSEISCYCRCCCSPIPRSFMLTQLLRISYDVIRRSLVFKWKYAILMAPRSCGKNFCQVNSPYSRPRHRKWSKIKLNYGNWKWKAKIKRIMSRSRLRGGRKDALVPGALAGNFSRGGCD